MVNRTHICLTCMLVAACGSQRESLQEDMVSGLKEPYRMSQEHPYGLQNPEAPDEMGQYAFMVGSFSCRLEDKEFRDGSWVPLREGEAIWRAHYVMNGHAILDEYRDEWGSKNVNIRVYSEEDDVWYVHWTAVRPTTGAVLEARQIDGAMVMESERETAGGFAYTQRISFRDMTDDGYLWTNEVVYKNGNAVVIGKIECARD